jgi:hypothetical protein
MENTNNKELVKQLGLVKADRAMKGIVLICFISVIGSIGVSLMVYLKANSDVTELENRVVVLDSEGKMSAGTMQELNEFERERLLAENVLRLGVEYMYSFSAANYIDRIDLARNYFGNSGNEILQGYVNDRVKEKVTQNNLRVDVAIKSIEVVQGQNGMNGKVVFEQSFINGDAVSKRMLSASCLFDKSKISSKNAYGLVIENWIIENEVR